MSNTTKNLKILWESERILRSAQWRITSQKLYYSVIAGITGLFGIGMINMALFYWLAFSLGKPQAALLVATINILIAVVLLLVANAIKPAPELDMVRDFRDSAMSDLEGEAQVALASLAQIASDVQGVQKTVSGFAQNPASALSPSVLIPAITTLSSLLGSGKKK